MNPQNHKSIYMWGMCIGGIGGLLFLVCFFFMFSNLTFLANPIFQKLYVFVDFVSLPIFYLIGDKLGPISFLIYIPLLFLYWAILGIAITCGLVWLYFLIFRKRQQISNSSLTKNK